jgi:hypothetical protein
MALAFLRYLVALTFFRVSSRNISSLGSGRRARPTADKRYVSVAVAYSTQSPDTARLLLYFSFHVMTCTLHLNTLP